MRLNFVPLYRIINILKKQDVGEQSNSRSVWLSCRQFLLTYDDTPEVRRWAEKFGLPYTTIPMQTTHLIKKEELLISNDFGWYVSEGMNSRHESQERCVKYSCEAKAI